MSSTTSNAPVLARLSKLRRRVKRLLRKHELFVVGELARLKLEALDVTNLRGLGSNPIYQQIQGLRWESAARPDFDDERRNEIAYAFLGALSDRLQLVEDLAPVKRRVGIYTRKTSKQMDRERRIRSVIQRGVMGPKYCKILDQEGIKPPPIWIDEGCPATYTDAYRSGSQWQKRIQNEKSKALRRASHSPNSPQAS